MDEKRTVGDVLFDLKRKWDNAWYHYKLAIIAGVVILTFIIIAISQCSSKVEGDANVAYIGPKELNSEEHADLQRNLDEIIGEDLNGDNKIHASLSHFLYMTDDQVRDERAEGRVIDMQALVVVQTQIYLELADTNIIIYFIDPEVYKVIKRSGSIDIFMPLEEVLGYVPEKQNDEFSLILKDLYCWEYCAGIGSFPDNTVIAVRDRQNTDKNDEALDEKYKRNLLLFKRMVEFTGFDD